MQRHQGVRLLRRQVRSSVHPGPVSRAYLRQPGRPNLADRPVCAPACRRAHGAVEADYFDVVIIGAGISGLGAAYRITERNPHLNYTILERREQIGGTWDLFRYPGVRSDSSIFTLSFPFESWTRREGVADGVHIRED